MASTLVPLLALLSLVASVGLPSAAAQVPRTAEDGTLHYTSLLLRGGGVVMPMAKTEPKAMALARTGPKARANAVTGPKEAAALPPLGSGYWSVKGGDFVDANGRVVRFSGVTWSGFETPDAVAHGLSQRSIDSHLDQMKALGLLVIRLAFAGDTLKRDTFPTVSITGANPDLEGLNSLQVMDKIVLGCGARGMKVILDYHRMHLTINNEVGTWFDDAAPEELWISNWALLARRYRGWSAVIGADLFNEVHPSDSFPPGAPFWVMDAGANEKYNFRSATVRLIQAVHPVNPDWIFFLEGMHNGYWWGGNVSVIMQAPITTPANKIALSTHEYGPYVFKATQFTDPNFPNNLPGVFRQNWGHLQETGTKPVWVGEFGSFYPEADSEFNDLEKVAFEMLVAYMKKIKSSWTLFQWTPDSKDTGGVLSDDWTSPNERKMKLLRQIMHPGFV